MLDELQRLHAEILDGLDQMAVLTAEPEPPMDRLPAARQRLTRASRARTLLLERVYDRPIAQAPAGDKAAIEALRTEGKADLLLSSHHIGSWTLHEVATRWADYCAASTTMRAAMRARVRKEMHLVYPSLSDEAY